MKLNNDDPLSIVTVCYNDKHGLRSTVDSVLKFSNLYQGKVDFIIIDGDSTDGTKEYLFELERTFTKELNSIHIVSESDSGIYNAMNKGVDIAKNEGYILFLNSSDILLDNATDILNEAELNLDIHVYRVTSSFDDGQKASVRQMKTVDEIRTWPCFPHQATLIRSALMKQYRYDEGYRILADYDFFCRCFENKCTIQASGSFLSDFKQGGVSNNSSFTFKYLNELVTIQKHYFGVYSKKLIFTSLVKLLIRSNSFLSKFEFLVRKLVFR